MSPKESHTIRNGVITAVLGGIILSFWPPFLTFLKKMLLWFWSVMESIFLYFKTEHLVYGWVLIILCVLSIIAIYIFISSVRKKELGVNELFTEDRLFGVDWFWSYVGNNIANTWCLCPDCKTELVYNEFIPDPYNYQDDNKRPYTEFICERCGNVKAHLHGNKSHALSTVEREIIRKIRTEEWKN